ncbi:hypothetical protein B566_EDAN003873 [Ephemera danica]|nr:hypothetical protein B566_EDAN003873 [Ephemera danica]
MTGRKADMQVNVAGLRRNLKNLAHNYSDAQIKVREATSNDPWGPSSTLMSEIADLTYNVVAFTEIMQMIWKRLNDHGRNWRHVYKALVLLEYLIKTGSEKQCKENIFAIQTLRDFQHVEESRDQGLNVREKAKHLVLLLKDEERLKNERARALKAKERFAQSQTGFGSDVGVVVCGKCTVFFSVAELESARPQTIGEEELQLQLALAMSREEAEQEEQRRRSDDVRLQLALSQSEEEFKCGGPTSPGQDRVSTYKRRDESKPETSHVLDLLDVNLGTLSDGAGAVALDPWGMPAPNHAGHPQPPARPQSLDVFCTGWASADPWSSPISMPSASSITSPAINDPWAPDPLKGAAAGVAIADPWQQATSPVPPPRTASQDPWSPSTDLSASPGSPLRDELDDFAALSKRDHFSPITNNNGRTISPDPFELQGLGNALPNTQQQPQQVKKTPQSFLGENSALVNLDNLVPPSTGGPAPGPVAANPFASSPFGAPPPKPTINQMMQRPPQNYNSDPWAPVNTLPNPLVPATSNSSSIPNPFLS